MAGILLMLSCRGAGNKQDFISLLESGSRFGFGLLQDSAGFLDGLRKLVLIHFAASLDPHARLTRRLVEHVLETNARPERRWTNGE